MNKLTYTISIDFDGTCVFHRYPELGELLPNAIRVLSALQSKGHKLILLTMRENRYLIEAVELLKEHGITFYAHNDNPSQQYWAPDSRKVYANFYIGDDAIGCPCYIDEIGRRAVDWNAVENILKEIGIL